MRKWVDLCFVSVILFVAGCRLRTPLDDMFGKNVSIPVSLNSLWFPLQKTCAGCVSLEKVSYETAVGFVLDKPDLRCSNAWICGLLWDAERRWWKDIYPCGGRKLEGDKGGCGRAV